MRQEFLINPFQKPGKEVMTLKGTAFFTEVLQQAADKEVTIEFVSGKDAVITIGEDTFFIGLSRHEHAVSRQQPL
jgi:hypothetical protein